MIFGDFVALVASQLVDPFRIGLIGALIYTTIRNSAVTGWLVPLGAGLLFVAYIIAIMFPKAGQTTLLAVGSGLVANFVIAGIGLTGLFVWQ
ncbi:MAG: hypothetical protein ACRCT6_07730, partial [Notoacmeibacter sp.]